MKRKRSLLLVFCMCAVLAAAGLAAYRWASGRSLGLRGRVTAGVAAIRAVAASRELGASNHGQGTDIIFLHHSVGNNLIEQGDLRGLFRPVGYDLWDQGYNNQGLRGPDGQSTGAGYSVPNDNTDPDGLAVVFAQKEYALPLNALSGLLQHEVILFKSCFPNSNIGSDEDLARLKSIYLGIRAAVDRHPDKLFVLLTTPPLNPAETNPGSARRARMLASWLASPEFTGGRTNLAVFDLFDLLAESSSSQPDMNMLKAAYRDGADSHPSEAANREIAPLLVRFVDQAVQIHRQSLAKQ